MSELDNLCRTAAVEKKGMTKRNRQRLQQFDDPKKLDALLNLPAKLMRIARQHDIGDEQAARTAMYAVGIELLIVIPVRINNVVGLELNRSILMPRDPKKGTGHISIPAHEVKNDTDIDFPLPKGTIALIQEYLDDFRPRITDKNCDWLFPNRTGDRRNTAGFSRQIGAKIRDHAGLEMNSHLFRHNAVKLIQSENPDALEVMRRLLGHKSLETTMRYYAEANTERAHRRYTDLIESKRENGVVADLPRAWRNL